MKNKFAFVGSLAVSLILPVVALAQTASINSACLGTTTVGFIGLVCNVIRPMLNIAIPLLIIVATIYFIWGVVKFIMTSDPEEKSQARNVMIQGIIGFVVIFALWGIVSLVMHTFGVDNSTSGSMQSPQL